MNEIGYLVWVFFTSLQLVDVDVIAGLDMMVQRGQWEKAIETAEQQVHIKQTNKQCYLPCCVTLSRYLRRFAYVLQLGDEALSKYLA